MGGEEIEGGAVEVISESFEAPPGGEGAPQPMDMVMVPVLLRDLRLFITILRDSAALMLISQDEALSLRWTADTAQSCLDQLASLTGGPDEAS